MSPQTRAALGLAAVPVAPLPVAPLPVAPLPVAPLPVRRPASGRDDAAELAVTMRVQRNLAIHTMAVLLGGLIAIPLALAAAPGLDRIRLGPVPLVWIVLGAGVYPLLLLLAARHRRSVDRLEDALAEREAPGPD